MNDLAIIPMPTSLVRKEGSFQLTSNIEIHAQENLNEIGEMLSSWILHSTGISLPVIQNSDPRENCIQLELNKSLDQLGSEGYRLLVSPERITL